MSEAAVSTDQWLEASATGSISVEQLDALVAEMRTKRETWEAAKETATAL